MVLGPNLLIGLAEVCVAFTGFIGIVVVLSSSGKGEWTHIDDLRFWTLMLNSLTPLALALLPLLFGPDSFRSIGLIVGGIWLVLLSAQAISALRYPGASSGLGAFVVVTAVIAYGIFVASATGISGAPLHQCYLGMILWNLTVAVVFFVRLLRSTRTIA